MGIRKYKATTNGRRNMNGYDFAEITKTTPEKSLLAPLKHTAGRNSYGHITVRHRGGGVKRQYRTLSELKMMFQQLLRQLNTIQIVLQILLYLFTLMVLNHTSSHLRA